jgi:hypothetical protein
MFEVHKKDLRSYFSANEKSGDMIGEVYTYIYSILLF